MKSIFTLLFLTYNIFLVTAQEMVSWNDLDKKPIITTCEEETADCTLRKIKGHIQANFNTDILGDSIARTPVSIKMIIDTSGVVKWAKAISKNKIFTREAEKVTMQLPDFNPGTKNGNNVNTILDFAMNLNNFKKDPSLIRLSDVDVPPLPQKCKGKENPRECFSNYLMYMLGNINTSLVKGDNFSAALSFTITKDGKVENVHCIGKNENLNKNIIKVIRKISRLTHAKKNGENVAVSFNMPFFGGPQ